ncbi:MAG: PQQ-binding-like beta-propeller repeat protein [Micropruina sp.]
MSRPDSFDRPPGWSHLEGPDGERPGAARPASEPSSSQGGRRGVPGGRPRWRRGRSRRHKGLGSQSAGPDFRWPSASPVPGGPGRARQSGVPGLDGRVEPGAGASTGEDGAHGVGDGAGGVRGAARGVRRGAKKGKRRGGRAAAAPLPNRPPQAPDAPAARLRRAVGLLALYVGIFVLIIVVLGSLSDRADRRTPSPGRTTEPVLSELSSVWSVQPAQLRPDLSKAEFLSPVDGSFDANRVVAIGTTWAVLTADTEDRRVALHGLDAATGRPLWRTDLPNGVCAAAPVKSRLVCAASTATDPATGLGVRWRISLFDPATGRESRGVDFTGWLTLIHVNGDRVLLVEQRQPAPHAVLTGLGADLRQRWKLDLRDQLQHAGLFSDNRIFYRKLPIPDGPALDRPRIRKVADGLTALWAGQTTAFVDLRTGTLAGMPRCSRLVDDGKRLWCNDGARAVAYSYALRMLYGTELNIRLAFPDRDPRAGDVTDPVFLRSDGQAVRVDLTTGATIGPLAQTRNGSAFGLSTSPKASFVAGRTLLWDSSTLFAVDARTGKLHWQRPKPRWVDEVWAWRGKLLITGSGVTLLDPADGRQLSAYRQWHGIDTLPVGDVLVGIGPDEVARLTDP